MKIFHQFHIQENDHNYILVVERWRYEHTTSGILNVVHLLSAVLSPGCANYGLKYLDMENSHSQPVGSQFVKKCFYVDDGATSTDTAERAIQFTHEARHVGQPCCPTEHTIPIAYHWEEDPTGNVSPRYRLG